MSISIDLLNAVTKEVNESGLVDNIWTSSRFLGPFMKSGRKLSRNNFTIPIWYKKEMFGGFVKKDASLVYQLADGITELEYSPKYVREPMALLDADINANMTNRQIIDLVKVEMQRSINAIDDKVATAFFRLSTVADPDSVLPDGQEKLINQTTSQSYGNIAADDFSTWIASIDSSTTLAAMTSAVLKAKVRSLFKGKADITKSGGGTERPTRGVTTLAIYGQIEENEGDKVRFTNEAVTRELGVEGIVICGVPIIYDDYQQSGHCIFYNEPHFFVFVDPHDDFVTEPWLRNPAQPSKVTHRSATLNFGADRRDCFGGFTALT